MNRLLRSILVVAAATLVAGSPVAAASCNGNGHNIVLSNGRASPGSGTPSTAITFSVRYADTGGCAPSRVTVTISGVGTLALTGSGSDYEGGVTYARTTTLAAGSHSFSFAATSGRKDATLAAVSPSQVVISAPTPRPTPTPAPPTAAPAPQPQPPPPPPPPTSPPTAAPTSPPTPEPTENRTAKPSPSERDGSSAPAATPDVTPHDTTPGGSWLLLRRHDPDAGPRLATSPMEWGGPSSFEFGQLVDDGLRSFGPVITYSVTTAGGLALFFILLRRRDPDGAAQPLMAATIPDRRAGPGTGSASERAVAESAVAPEPGNGDVRRPSLPSFRELVPPIDYDLLRDPDGPSGPAPDEAGVPRWLRPSVRTARFGEVTRRRDWGD